MRRGGTAVARGLAALLAVWLGLIAPARAEVLAAYVVLGPDGAVARAVVEGDACPALALDGGDRPMQVRAAADSRYPLICEALLPADAAAARIAGRTLPMRPKAVRRIAVFGDSGCRIDARAGEFQACNDAAAWPFARTSAAAAALAPDLVIHVGDYLYRESPCPGSVPGCAGSPVGDDWPAWQADFFAPAAPLLAAAPWIFVRGNHENCDRSGEGFFRLLDPRPRPEACPAISATYQVAAGGLDLAVLDSGEAPDAMARDGPVAAYRRALAAIEPRPGQWLLTHRPIWAVLRVRNALGMSALVNDNATLQAASDNRLPPAIALVLSGHIHLFEALSFADRRPPQLVLGTAGSSLGQAIATDLAGHEIGGTTIAYGRTLQGFGVTLMERTDTGWSASLRDVDGAIRFICAIADATVACSP